MAFNDTLFQLGMDLTRSSTAQKEDHFVAESEVTPAIPKDIVRKDKGSDTENSRFAGHHLIIDLYGAERLDDVKSIERTLKLVSAAAEAKVERVHLYRSGNGGVTGLAVLAEGHISVQTRPETGFAAFDVLMTGNAKPQRCVEDLRVAFSARDVAVKIVKRGAEIATLPWKPSSVTELRSNSKTMKAGRKARAA